MARYLSSVVHIVSSPISSVLQPNSPQAMVATALGSANKTRLVSLIYTALDGHMNEKRTARSTYILFVC